MKNIYSILEVHPSADSEWRGSIGFDPGHSVFNGHFPGQPVVPGACLLDMVTDIAAMQLHSSLFLVDAPVIKFLQQVLPEHTLTVHISWKPVDIGFALTASAICGDAIVFKINADYRTV
jgi:3-hydroxyacyl-[acyl-carrier-protein] dehydratase